MKDAIMQKKNIEMTRSTLICSLGIPNTKINSISSCQIAIRCLTLTNLRTIRNPRGQSFSFTATFQSEGTTKNLNQMFFCYQFEAQSVQLLMFLLQISSFQGTHAVFPLATTGIDFLDSCSSNPIYQVL